VPVGIKGNRQLCNRTKRLMGITMIRRNLCARGAKLCSPLHCSIKISSLVANWGSWRTKIHWAGHTELETEGHRTIWLTDCAHNCERVCSRAHWIHLAEERSLRSVVLSLGFRTRRLYMHAFGPELYVIGCESKRAVFIILYISNKVI